MDEERQGIRMADLKGAAGMAKNAGLLDGKNSRIGNGTAAILILAALIADIFTFIPFVGDVVGPIFWVCVSLYFWAKGFGFMRMGRLVTELISTAAEMIPAVQELPTIVVGMIIVIILMRLEDKTGKSLLKPMSKGKNPLNTGGVRLPQRNDDAQDAQTESQRNPNTRPLNIDSVRGPSNDEDLPLAA